MYEINMEKMAARLQNWFINNSDNQCVVVVVFVVVVISMILLFLIPFKYQKGVISNWICVKLSR